MKSRFAALTGVLLSLCVIPTALAADAAERIAVQSPRVRLLPPPTTGAFMTLRNEDTVEHAVTGAESEVARAVELHNHVNEGGMFKMRPVERITLPPGSEVVLKPGGLHVMLIGLKRELKEGERILITLRFEDGSTKPVEAVVQKLQAGMGGPGAPHGPRR